MGEQREPARRKVEAIALIAGELRLWRVAGTNDSFRLTPTIFGPKMDGGYGAGRAVQNAKLNDRIGRVSRAPRELSAARNCTRDEGGPFEFGDQEPISSHRKLLRAKAVVVSVAETPGQDFGRHGRERRAQANRCRNVESGLGDVRTGG